MRVVIIALGVLGLGAAAFCFVESVVEGVRRRHYLDIAAAVVALGATVWLLFSHGDTFLN